MAQVPFTVSARAARLIGRENVSNAEGALIELVKNCYDADSLLVIILFRPAEGKIFIIDAGEGMTDDTIKNQWMIVGTDDKLTNATTAKGRIKSGAKGIGRFALDRLGERCLMVTVPSVSNIQRQPVNKDKVITDVEMGFKWAVNWSDFESKNGNRNKHINEVFAELDEIKHVNYKDEVLALVNDDYLNKIIAANEFVSGTLLMISDLRDKWTKESLDKVFENLKLLAPPDGSNKMKMYMCVEDDGESYGEVEAKEFEDYDYKLVANYKKNPDHVINVAVFRNEVDLNQVDDKLFSFPEMKVFPFDERTMQNGLFNIKKTFNELLKGAKDKDNVFDSINDFEFVFYFLKNSFSKDDREKYKYKELKATRNEWLNKFGGIKIYRDNFRVRPYGEINSQGFDWLMLGERQAQSPAGISRKGGYRVGPNQVAGTVKISRVNNLQLDDKSNREGIQESPTLDLFRNLLISIIKLFEDDRSTLFSNLSELYNLLNEDARAIHDSNAIANESTEDESNDDKETTKAKNRKLKQGVKALDRRLRDKTEELSISRAMASAGIMIASFSHEFHKINNKLNTRTSNLKVFLDETIDQEKLKIVPDRKNPFKLLEDIQKQDEKIKQWIEFAAGLTKKDRRRNKNVDIVQYFNEFTELWAKMFEERNIEFSFKCAEEDKPLLNLKISELDLDTIFDNLLTNSIEAFQQNGFNGAKIITCTASVVKRKLNIKYKDSGPGIPSYFNDVNAVFNLFETSKRDDNGDEIGTGLGMWLLKSAVDSNNGKVFLSKARSGFEIDVQFNLIKK